MRDLSLVILLEIAILSADGSGCCGDDMVSSPSTSAAPQVRCFPTDPGRSWTKEMPLAIDAPPDEDINSRPESTWPTKSRRSGICGAVSPRVIALPSGGFRLYYSQLLPRPGFPAGANDYENCTSRILSAFSADGETWTPEPGVRLSPQQGGAGDFRVVSSEVVPASNGSALRMYYECCAGSQSITNSIRSALSTDGGLEWTTEPGSRIESAGRNYSAPRVIFLGNGRCRMYYCDRGHGIVSAVSDDGLKFVPEPGVRVAQTGKYDSHAAFAPELFRVANAKYVMYYAGYSQSNRAQILRAVSDDGLTWIREAEPVISPGPGGWDAVKCSEMCVILLPQREGSVPRYRILYEACDGTSEHERGVWRIASATNTISPLRTEIK